LDSTSNQAVPYSPVSDNDFSLVIAKKKKLDISTYTGKLTESDEKIAKQQG
jgi:hypothetical protein